MALGLDPLRLQALLQQVGPLLESGFAAQQDQALAPLQSAVQQAQAQAQTAQQNYAQAAAAPPPQYQGHLDQLLGNVGSVLSGNPAYGQQAHQRTEGRQNDLMEQRRQNLAGLQALYAQKADAAEKLGNMEMAEKARTSHERVARQLQQMDDQTRFDRQVGENKRKEGFEADQKRLDRENELKKAQISASKGSDSNVSNTMSETTLKAMAGELLAGRIKVTDLSGQRYRGNDSERDQVVTYLANTNQKILPPKVRDTLSALRAAESLVSQIEEKALGAVDPKSGKRKGGVNKAEGAGPLGIGAAVRGLQRAAGVASRTDPAAISLDNVQQGFLATLARATGEKGTLNEGDIKRAKKLLSKLGDPRGVAEVSVRDLRNYLADMRESAIRTATEVQPEQVQQDPLGILSN